MNNPLHAARSDVWLGDLPCSHRSFMDREEIQSSKTAPIVGMEEGLLCFVFLFLFLSMYTCTHISGDSGRFAGYAHWNCFPVFENLFPFIVSQVLPEVYVYLSNGTIRANMCGRVD